MEFGIGFNYSFSTCLFLRTRRLGHRKEAVKKDLPVKIRRLEKQGSMYSKRLP
jgi:hypothetical protein